MHPRVGNELICEGKRAVLEGRMGAGGLPVILRQSDDTCQHHKGHQGRHQALMMGTAQGPESA